MLLEPLVSTIEAIKGRIATHGTTLRQNETRTRTALIDPLLQALGWDAADPSLVTPEYRVDVGWADYALLGVGNKPTAVIEAKRLGSIVENHLEQAVGYCIQQGIAYAGVTDGNHWQLYRTFEPVPLVEKLVLDVSIADLPAHEAGLKLLLLWQMNLATGQAAKPSTPVLLAEPSDKGNISVQRNHSSEIADQISSHAAGNAQPPVRPVVAEQDWTPFSKVVHKSGDRPPSRLRFADGSERNLRRAWAALVENIIEWLWSNDLLAQDDVPIPSGKRRNIVNSEPRHPEGNEFNQPANIEGTPLWIDRNINGQVAVANSRTLLERFGVSQDSILVWFE